MNNNRDASSERQAALIKAFEDMAERLDAIMEKRKEEGKAKAQRVYDIFMEGSELVDIDDKSDSASIAANRWVERLDEAIKEDLNISSIAYFIELVGENHLSAIQAAKSKIRHAENHAMRDDIYKWMDDNYDGVMSFDSAASEIAGKIVPLAWRTVREHITEWNKLRSAG